MFLASLCQCQVGQSEQVEQLQGFKALVESTMAVMSYLCDWVRSHLQNIAGRLAT